jgi:hypothetical protein
MANWKKLIVSGSSPEFADVTLSGDLTVTGGDITLGSTSIFSGGDTTSLNNIDAIDATTEATIESAIDTLGNLTTAGSLVTVGTLGSGTISSGFGNIDIGTSTFNAGNTTVDNFTNNSTVAASHLTGSFTGSFIGDGSGLNGVANEAFKTVTVSGQDNVVASLESTLTVASGNGVAITTNSNTDTITIATAAIPNSSLTNSSVSYGGISLSLGGSDATPAFNLTDATNYPYGSLTGTPAGIVSGSVQVNHDAATNFVANEHIDHSSVTLTAGSGLTGGGTIAASRTFNIGAGTGISVAADSISIGQAVGTSDDVTFNNVTVDGNLDVNGTVTTIQSTNLLVSDRFILMNSGSASGDGGIIIQTETTASGSGFVWDDTESRWGYQQGTKLAQDASVSAPDAYAAAVVTTADVNYQKNGNIRVESGEIYIYVE